MDYKTTKDSMMECYPGLFPYEHDVLNHLFFVNGNGLDWIDGQLTDGLEDPKEHLRLAKEGRVENCMSQIEWNRDKGLDTSYWEDLLEEDKLSLDERRSIEIARRIRYMKPEIAHTFPTQCWYLVKEDVIGTYIYPLCEYASIFHIPEDVKTDWLNAAEHAMSLVNEGIVLKPNGKYAYNDNEWLAKANILVADRQFKKDDSLSDPIT